FSYSPASGFTGNDSFTYKASDGTHQSAAATVTITVTANVAPTATPDTFSTTQNITLSIPTKGVLLNDTDPQSGTTLTAVDVTQPGHGQVTLNTDGSFTYVPATDFSGADSFTYKASDGTMKSAAATVTITVAPVNDNPLTSTDTFFAVKNRTFTSSATGVLANDSDPEGSPLTVTVVPGSGVQHGTLTLSTN